ncbi:WAT1-related protein At5g64700 isoform X2 [Setaria italica]|uniref:WAT1-related protein At5g64700 isoform X2 n=2 Tax=Setaria TaxID=4554 RepID=UPI0006472062|nr:WAT1-related protein At5g64700 isoform X2 [Setaria italica]
MNIVAKGAFDEGMSTSVFVLYRHAIAIPFLLPIAYMLERKTSPALTFKASLKLFVHALYGIESLNMKRFQGIVKVTGIVFCFAGVIVLAFYQGPEMKSFNHHRLLHQTSNSHATVIVHSVRTWLLGIFLMTLGTICWAFWTVLQGPILDAYPSKLLNTSLQIVFATIQSFFIALVVERDFSRWKLKLDISLIAVLYCGVLVTGVGYYMQIWVIDKSGPVFLAMTMPITLLVTIVLSSLLGEAVTLGSILGGVVMVGGLYCVLWAKKTEQVDVSKEQMAAPVQETEV